MQIQEYKRTCKECGKVWHSLVSREEMIQKQFGYKTSPCCVETETDRKISQACPPWLHEYRRCPNCQSYNYKEEIITFEKEC